jgi:protein-tyrosine kinase
MNRMEEALLRARQDTKLPQSFDSPDTAALGRFPSAGSAVPPGDTLQAVPDDPEGRPIDQPASAATAVGDAGTETSRLVAPPPDHQSRRDGTRLNGPIQRKLITNASVGGATVEQYRQLAATLHHAQNNDRIKVVMIASALPAEGKTLTAVNLALTLSESYERRVLLIDADLRRPALHQMFQSPNTGGLHEGLKAESERQLDVFEVSPRLSLLPAGKPDPDPMSALTSARMRRVIESAAEAYDWVLIDTPPVGLLPDAHLLAAMVHVAVLVVQAGRTPLALIQRAIESLDRNRIIGVVLNLVEDRALTPGGKYSQYYAYSYGDTDRRGSNGNGKGPGHGAGPQT